MNEKFEMIKGVKSEKVTIWKGVLMVLLKSAIKNLIKILVFRVGRYTQTRSWGSQIEEKAKGTVKIILGMEMRNIKMEWHFNSSMPSYICKQVWRYYVLK